MKKTVMILILIINSISYSYINIYPIKFEKDITEGAYEEFTLYNRSNKVRRYRIYIEDVEGRNSMKDWIEVYPKSISIKSLEEKKVKIFIEAPGNIKNGIYESNFVVKEILPPTTELTNEEKNKKTNILTMVKLRLKGKIER